MNFDLGRKRFLQRQSGAPAFRKIILRPQPAGDLTFASGSYGFASERRFDGAQSTMYNSMNRQLNWQNVNNLTYSKKIGDHHFTATAVWEMSKYEYNYIYESIKRTRKWPPADKCPAGGECASRDKWPSADKTILSLRSSYFISTSPHL
ncbi:MAG: hypothetical protein LBD52_06705 [Prevotellaceae bacterium]|nr:hypothetical protein [Prevotellaceae bacterium]